MASSSGASPPNFIRKTSSRAAEVIRLSNYVKWFIRTSLKLNRVLEGSTPTLLKYHVSSGASALFYSSANGKTPKKIGIGSNYHLLASNKSLWTSVNGYPQPSRGFILKFSACYPLRVREVSCTTRQP